MLHLDMHVIHMRQHGSALQFPDIGETEDTDVSPSGRHLAGLAVVYEEDGFTPQTFLLRVARLGSTGVCFEVKLDVDMEEFVERFACSWAEDGLSVAVCSEGDDGADAEVQLVAVVRIMD